MKDLEDRKYELIGEYVEVFGKGPPVWGMDDERAIKLMEAALKDGKPVTDTGTVLPDDTVM